jgi:hypothetical protein
MAFSNKRLMALKESALRLYERAIAHHCVTSFTNDEIYYAMVNPDHVPKLREVEGLVGTVQRHSQYSLSAPQPFTNTRLTMHFADAITRLLPAYCSTGFQEAADRDVMEKIEAWMQRRYYIAQGFTKLNIVLEELDRKLNNPAQLRFYFNGIVALLRMNEDSLVLANKLEAATFPGRLPSIDPELRQAGLDSSKFLSQMLLLPKETPNPSAVMFTVEEFGFEKVLGLTRKVR